MIVVLDVIITVFTGIRYLLAGVTLLFSVVMWSGLIAWALLFREDPGRRHCAATMQTGVGYAVTGSASLLAAGWMLGWW